MDIFILLDEDNFIVFFCKLSWLKYYLKRGKKFKLVIGTPLTFPETIQHELNFTSLNFLKSKRKIQLKVNGFANNSMCVEGRKAKNLLSNYWRHECPRIALYFYCSRKTFEKLKECWHLFWFVRLKIHYADAKSWLFNQSRDCDLFFLTN